MENHEKRSKVKGRDFAFQIVRIVKAFTMIGAVAQSRRNSLQLELPGMLRMGRWSPSASCPFMPPDTKSNSPVVSGV